MTYIRENSRFSKILAVNLLVFIVLFLMSELAYRGYRDGFPDFIFNMVSFTSTPYSNLGTNNWVVYDKELGFRLNPDLDEVNSISVKQAEEIAIPKPKGVFRAIFLGDSVTFDQPGLVSLIRDRISGDGTVEVINASTPGYTSYQELVWLKRDLAETSPDVVILNYVLNDNHMFLHRFDADARMLMTREALNTWKSSGFVDRIIGRSYILIDVKFRALNVWKQVSQGSDSGGFVWENRADVAVAWRDETWGQFEKYLVEMKALVEQNGGVLTVVIYPFAPQFNEEYLSADREYVLKPQSNMASLCEAHDMACLDLFPVFEEVLRSSDAELFRDSIHLSLDGHELVADTILEFLSENKLLPESAR